MSRKIFIMGASTGIGKALAKRYANQDTILGLAARRVDLLENVAASCRKNNAQTYRDPRLHNYSDFVQRNSLDLRHLG